MEERTRPAVMTLALKIASDSEKLASIGLDRSMSSFQKRSQGGSFFKRAGGIHTDGPVTRDSANSGSSGVPASAALTLDAFAKSLSQETPFVGQVG